MGKGLFERKWAVFFVSFFALISLILLAGTLNNLSFRPAQPLSRTEKTETETVRFSIGEVARIIVEIPLRKQIVFFAILSLLVVLIASLLSPEMRKRLIRMFIRAAISALILIYVLKTYPDLLTRLLPQLNLDNGKTNPSLTGNMPPPVFEPPQISDTLSFFISLGIVLISAVFAWRFYLWWKRQSGLASSSNPLNKLARIARTSLRELSLGQASHDAIIQCYENMSRVVDKRRGLHRSHAMTAAEFARNLENAGLPREPVNRLTRLFESARYSARASTQNDIDEAIACLTSILKYCGEMP